ncbi:MAG TPA: SPFH domain-containing protein [Polyangiaceae bacterium]|nr:SPFH domain-containing protein [Polyangiaceae bacterium]
MAASSLDYGVWFVVGFVMLAVAAFIVWLGARVIKEDESGLVIKRYGAALPAGRIVATQGEAGYQAAMLPPGFHFPVWRFRYKVEKVPVVVVPAGEIALVVAADGATIPQERVLARAVPCSDFQDAHAFLLGGGERGRQIAFLTAGTYRINPALFEVVTASTAERYGIHPSRLRIRQIPTECVGIVTTLDGASIPAGDLAGPLCEGHDSFQNGQAFVDVGGCRGLQEQVLLAGSWNLNPWLVFVEEVPLTEIPIGYVGVVVSYVGRDHIDVSGETFTHGDLVDRGHKGVWVEALLPGKHPLNPRVMKVELVPTTNIVLNWAARTEVHHYDERLAPIHVRSRDGFSFSLEVSQIIHIGMKHAPRVISRVGSMQNLVDHVLQPTVGNYFRNSAQKVTVLEFLSARSDRQREAFAHIRSAIAAYDVECIDTLIGDIEPPAELMKTQTDRKIAEELQVTYDVQRQAQIQRQTLERETAIAGMQAEVVRSEQMVQIAEKNALAQAESAKGAAAAVRLGAEAQAIATRAAAEAEAAATRFRGEAEGDALRAVGNARADAFKAGVIALGPEAFAAMQLATVLGEHQVKLVPDIAVTGGGADAGTSTSRLADVLVGKMLAAGLSRTS